MTLTTIGFFVTSESLNDAASGFTLAGIAWLLLLGLSAVYLIWRRGTFAPAKAVRFEPVPGRGRRG
jgi:hypothetical protein